jgi:uncharacterized membrane protein YvlD (DUF360 family)
LRTVLGILGRYLLVWLVAVLGLLIATSILPGLRFDTSVRNWWTVALILPVQLAVLIILLRPLMLLATLPLNSLTLGIPTLFFNGIILYLAARLNPAIIVTNYFEAFLGAVVLTVVMTGVVGWLGLDEAYPIYQELLYRLGRRFGPTAPPGSRGVLLLQVDGLSRTSFERALERGRMPSASGLIARGSHRLFGWHCGIPSNTPAVQAGLLYGLRFDVPGYRWYDREAGRVRMASHSADLRRIEEQVAALGEPLLAGGSCIGSFLSGGAAKRLMTVSAIGDKSGGREGERADFNLFFLSPFAYPKAVIASIWDYLTGVVQAIIGRWFTDRPRLRFDPKRLAQRSVANAFLRETAFFWLKQDMVRGVPVIFSNFVGYDDVAHYSDPDAYDAQISLAAFDRMLRRLRRRARRKYGSSYDFVLFSDHGQTPSLPFRLLYGRTLQEAIGGLAGAVVADASRLRGGVNQVTLLLAEFERMPAEQLGRAAARGRRTLRRISRRPAVLTSESVPEGHVERVVRPERAESVERWELESREELESPTEIIVCASGSLAHVYFTGTREARTLEPLRGEYPGLVEALARHPGIAFVAAIRESGDAVAIGSDGIRNLVTGQVVGDRDPLAVFGDVDVWSEELVQLLGYPSSGDLVLQGAWWPERERVVVFEEQSSSHGGMGGRQTEPFILVPEWWGTQNSDLRSPESLHRHLRANLRRYRQL